MQSTVLCLSGLGGNWMTFDFNTLVKRFKMKVIDFDPIFECASRCICEIFKPDLSLSFKEMLLNNCYLFEIDPFLGAIALTVVQICQIDMLKKKNVAIDFVIAHSMGEFAAAYAANVLSYEQVIFLAVSRSFALFRCETIPYCRLLAARSNSKIALNAAVSVACVNSENSTVFVGTDAEVAKAQSELRDLNILSVRIDTDGIPFHSSKLLASSMQNMLTVMSNQSLSPMLKPANWLSTFEHPSNMIDVDYFVRAATQPVDFCTALRSLPANCRVIELGIDEVMKCHIQQEAPGATYTAISQFK